MEPEAECDRVESHLLVMNAVILAAASDNCRLNFGA